MSTFNDAGDRVREDRVADGKTLTTRWTFDAEHRQTSVTDPTGNRSSVTYDVKDNVLTRTNPVGLVESFEYNEWGQPTALHKPGGVGDTALAYDDSGNLTTITPATGAATVLGYDQAGHVTSVGKAGMVPAKLTYVSAGDGAGLVESLTDAVGKVTSARYDATGKIVSETDPAGTTAYRRDAAGRVVEQVNAKGGKRTWGFDAAGQLVAATDEVGGVARFTYDELGRLATVVDRNGVTSTIGYDTNGRRVSKVAPGFAQSWSYDGLGRLVKAVDGETTMTTTYDGASRVTGVRTAGPGLPDIGFAYAHCACGALASVTGPGGTTSYAYDEVTGSLASVTGAGGDVFGFTWDVAGRLESMSRPNQVSDVFAWNDLGQLLTRSQVKNDGTVVDSVGYGYDVSGRRTSMSDRYGAHAFSYDPAGNLTGADHPDGFKGGDETFTYDALGNRTSDSSSPGGSMVYDAANRLARDATSDYWYDGEGNLTTVTVRSTGARTTYTWDVNHRLTAITAPNGTVTSYRYDAGGKRIQATAAGKTTTWAYDRQWVAAVWENTGTGHVLVHTYTTTPGGDPLLGQTGQDKAYPVLDGLGSITATLDGVGGLATTTAYGVFGDPRATTGVGLDDTYAYTGHAWDPGAGMYYARARWYKPTQGRFASEDPVWHPNLYPYVDNQPLTYTDPTGKTDAFFEAKINLLGVRMGVRPAQWISWVLAWGGFIASAAKSGSGPQSSIPGNAANAMLFYASMISASALLASNPPDEGLPAHILKTEFLLAGVTTDVGVLLVDALGLRAFG